MPKRTTTAAITLLTNEAGRVQLALNAKAAPGGSITEWSVDWGDDETEDHTEPSPGTVTHSYVTAGPVLIVFTVKDTKTKIVSEGLNAIVDAAPIVVPPEEGTFDALIPPSDSGTLFTPKTWQYQSMAAPMVLTASQAPSANGTTIVAPTGRLVAPDASVWTWGPPSGLPGQHYAYRNQVDTTGYGTKLKTCDGFIYLLGSDGQTWFRYHGSYDISSTVEPCAGGTR
jgi:hypothetical protein